MPSICIISNGEGEANLLNIIYENVKHDIPKVFAKRFAYSGQGQLNLPLPEESPSYSYVMDIAEKYRLHPTVYQIVYYTKAEIENSEYFVMNILSPLEAEGTDAADYGTQYEEGCPNQKCRLGKKLIGNVLLDRKYLNQKSWDIGTLRPDIYVSEKLNELIHVNNFTGVSFDYEIRDFKGRGMPKYFIMDIHNILPPMAASTWLIRDEHEHSWYMECGHQIIYLRSDIQYEREKLEHAQDFNLSAEFVDNFRLQKIIVSARVRKAFMQNKIHAGFFPVALL